MLVRSFSTTLGWYLTRRYFSSIFITTALLLGFVFIIDMIETMRKLASKPDVSSELALQLVLLKMPDLLMQLSPFAILIGTLVSFARLSRDHEFIAIRTSGLPARQFLIPPFLVCLIIGLFNLTVMNPFSAATLKSQQRLENELFPGSAQGLITEGGHIWLKQREGNDEYIIYARKVEDQGQTLRGATLYHFNELGDFVERIDSPLMELKKDYWQLLSPLILKPSESSERKGAITIKTTMTDKMIRNSFTSHRTLSVWEMEEFISRLKETGFPTQRHEMYYQKLLASPALILAMFLLGAPFALHFSRHRGMTSMVLTGVGLGFAFYLFANFVEVYGVAGRINISLAAWLPTLIAGLVGISLLLHFREE